MCVIDIYLSISKHDEFILSVNFNTIIEVFNEYPALAPVSHIIRDLTNPEVLRELEEIGINVQLSKELLEINDLTKPATIKQDYPIDEEKHTALSKQLSSSDGCLHVLGIKEHSSLTVNN